jgi:predicted permease
MAYIAGLVVPIFAVIALGRAAIWLRILNPGGLAGLNGFAFWVALPALLFGSVAELATAGWLQIAVLYLAASIALYAVALAIGHLMLGGGLSRTAVFALNSTYGNVIFLGIPVVSAVFGAKGVALILPIIAFHSGVLLPVAAVLVEIGTPRPGGVYGVLKNTAAALLRNPIILAIALGFAWRAAGIPVPGPLRQLLALLGNAAAPLALFCLGASLPPLARNSPVMREAVLATSLKLLVLPLCVGTLARMAGLSGLPWTIAVITAAMPTGANAFLLARKATDFAEASAATVVLSTALSVATITGLITWIR